MPLISNLEVMAFRMMASRKKDGVATMEIWTIQEHGTIGGYAIVNNEGETKGRYVNAMAARSHHAMALAQHQKLRTALEKCLRVIEKGIDVRLGDQWPAIRDLMPDAVREAKEALNGKSS